MNGSGVSADDLDALAARALDLVAGRAEAAVTVRDLREGLTRFANSFIHQNVGDRRVTLTLDVARDGRTASSTTTDTSDGGVRRLVESALAAATVQPVDEDWPGLAPPAPPVGAPGVHYDRATAEAGPAGRADVVASFVAAGAGLEAAGYCETEVTDALFVNSAGQRIADSVTSAAVDGIHRSARSDGSAAARSVRLADVDGAALGAAAAAVARDGTDAIELPAGRYEVVLERRAVAYMLDFFTVYGFNARAVQEGRSFAFVGEEQFDRALSIWDDATDRRQVGLGFDAEGTPKRRVDLVDAGRVVGVTHDRRTAARDGGAESTGHAVAGGSSIGALASNLFVGGAAPTPLGELVGRVRRGLLVKDFWYTRVLDPRSLVVTGLTRNGVFLIEDGHIGPAVTNLRFTQSPVAAFGPGAVLGVGDDAALAPGGLHLSWHHAPSLHLAAWNFTGNASG
jgi:predicted Zn-dependent protease